MIGYGRHGPRKKNRYEKEEQKNRTFRYYLQRRCMQRDLDFCKRNALLLQPNSVLLEIHRIYGIRLYGEIPAMARNVVLHLHRSPLVWTGKAAYRNLSQKQLIVNDFLTSTLL